MHRTFIHCKYAWESFEFYLIIYFNLYVFLFCIKTWFLLSDYYVTSRKTNNKLRGIHYFAIEWVIISIQFGSWINLCLCWMCQSKYATKQIERTEMDNQIGTLIGVLDVHQHVFWGSPFLNEYSDFFATYLLGILQSL